MKNNLSSKALFAIYKLGGEGIPCKWATKQYFWRDYTEAKFLNNNYLLLLTQEHGYNRYFVFSIKENLLVDGFHHDSGLTQIFDCIRQFKRHPEQYGV